jgi:DUF4097 and DUF4098 domain-containing protein YvlB
MSAQSLLRHATAVAVLLVGGAAPLAAQRGDTEWTSDCRQRDHYGDERERYCEVRVSGFPARGGRITAEPGQNNGVEFIGWDRDSVSVHARIQAGAESAEDARALAGRVQIVSAASGILAQGPDNRRRESWSVNFVVYVPRKSDLSAHTYNGPLQVSGVTGQMDLRTVNGPLGLADVGGNVRARAENGPLEVALGGHTWSGEGLDAETVNGPLQLAIPSDYSARLETGTENGPMSVNFPITMTVQGRLTRRLSTVLGSGGPTVRAVTTNGPVEINRR